MEHLDFFYDPPIFHSRDFFLAKKILGLVAESPRSSGVFLLPFNRFDRFNGFVLSLFVLRPFGD